MADWINTVAVDDVEDGKLYFIGLPPTWKYGAWVFWSEFLNGKRRWSEKPGIALRYEGSDSFRQELRRQLAVRPGIRIVEVPANADKRWRARESKRYRSS